MSMEGAVELNAPTNVGTVFNPRRLGGSLTAWTYAAREPVPLELLSFTKTPRVLVMPLGSTRRMELLGD
jgi:hypothetical protein